MMMAAGHVAVGGLVRVDVDHAIVHLDLDHSVDGVLALVAGGGRDSPLAPDPGGHHPLGLLAAGTALIVGRTLVALAPEANQVALAGEVAVFALGHATVPVTELADRTVVPFLVLAAVVRAVVLLLVLLRPVPSRLVVLAVMQRPRRGTLAAVVLLVVQRTWRRPADRTLVRARGTWVLQTVVEAFLDVLGAVGAGRLWSVGAGPCLLVALAAQQVRLAAGARG